MKKGIILLLIGLLCISLFGCGDSGKGSSTDNSTRILIENSEGLSAIYTLGGKQITDFKFESIYPGEIANGVFSANDSTDDEAYTRYLFDENGNNLLKENESITSYFKYVDNLFVLDDGENEKLINAKQEVVLDVTDLYVKEYIEVYNFVTAYDKKNKLLYVITNTGEVSEAVQTENYNVYSQDTVGTIVCDDKTFVVTYDKITIADIVDGQYYPANYYSGESRDMSQAVIYSDDYFRYYKDNKCAKEFSRDEYYSVVITNKFGSIQLVTYTDKNTAYIEDDRNKQVVMMKEYSKSAQLDYNTYAIVDSSSQTCSFYVDGELVATKEDIKDCNDINIYADKYSVEKTDGLCYVYDKNGNQLMDTGYYSIKMPNYTDVELEFYMGYDKANKVYQIMDKDFNVIIENVKDASVFEVNGNAYIQVVFEYDVNYGIYDSEFNEIVGNLDRYYERTDDYIKDSTNFTYYNYKGEVIYSELATE